MFFLALSPFYHTICSTCQLICPLPLTYSSEASISKLSKNVVFAVDEWQKEFFLFQQYAAFQRKLPILQRGLSNSTASSPTNHSVKSELDIGLDDLKKKVQAVQSGIAEGKIGNREGQENFPKGALAPCTPSHPFSSITLLTYTVQLEWLTSIP